MGDTTEEIKTSKTSFKTDGKIIEVKNNRKQKCPVCDNKNTICIFESASGSIIGYSVEDEYYCDKCKTFILYCLDYES